MWSMRIQFTEFFDPDGMNISSLVREVEGVAYPFGYYSARLLYNHPILGDIDIGENVCGNILLIGGYSYRKIGQAIDV